MKIYTDLELKQLAADIVDGKVFTNQHVDDHRTVIMVFMPLSFGFPPEVDTDDVGLVYEYLSEAGPMAVNGMPIFYSFRLINKAQTDILFTHVRDYQKLKEQFIS